MATVSASKIARWRRCARKAYYWDVMKIKRKVQSVAPTRGTLGHKALEVHYKGGDWTKPIAEATLDLDNVFDEEREEFARMKQDLYKILRGYFRYYRERDKDIKVLAVEQQFEIPIRALDGSLHKYTGTIDLIYEDATGVWVRDHKFVKTIPQPEELYMDLQTLMYYVAAQHLGYKPVGVEFNHIRTKVPTEPKLLKNGQLSKDKSIDCDVLTYFAAVKAHGLNPEDYRDMIEPLSRKVFYKRTRIPLSERTVTMTLHEVLGTASDIDERLKKYERFMTEGWSVDGVFPRTMMKNRCSWDCEYYKLCFSELAGMNVSGMLEEEYEQREERYDDEKVEEA